MSDRGFLGFAINGEEKITFICDLVFPKHMGARLLAWLGQELPHNAQQLRDQASALRVVRNADVPSQEDIADLAPWTDLEVSKQSTSDWYCLLRRTQCDPVAMLTAGVLLDDADFALNSIWCDWGYVVDFDTSRFEVYRGGQRFPHTMGRFADRPRADDGYPAALAGSWPLDELPSRMEFSKAMRPFLPRVTRSRSRS